MVCGTYAHLDDIRTSQYQSIDWTHAPSRTSLSYIDLPMVHTRDREPIAPVVRRWLDLQEILGSNPASVLSLMWLPESC